VCLVHQPINRNHELRTETCCSQNNENGQFFVIQILRSRKHVKHSE
jgi:hypothetical protein